MRNGVASSRLTDLGAISAACTVTIGAAKVCHCADICTGTEHCVVGAGFKLITVADDTELIREGLKSMLLQLPNPAICPEIRTACNGAEALSLMREHPVDLLITDIRMPDVDGIELMRQCRSQWANTSIVVISGYDDFKYAQQAIEYGASAYLLKPVDKQELYRVVEKAWQSANARRATIVNTSYSLFVNYLRGESSNAGILEQMKRTYPFLSGACALMLIGFPGTGYIGEEQNRNASLLCNRLGRPFLCMEDRSEIIVLAPYPVDIRKYYLYLEQDFHGICIAYTMVGREADAFKTAYQQVRNIYVHRLLYPGKSVLCQEDIAGMRTDFTVPHRKIEQMTELTGTAADEALTKRLSELFDRQKLVQYSIGYTLALCDTVYRAMRQTALSIPGGEAVDLERVKSPLTFATMREYLVNVNERLLSLNQLAHTYMQSRNDTYVMELAIQYIRRNYPKPITLAMVSNEVSLNYAYFSTMFSKYTGKTFSEYLRNTRMEKAKELLRQPDISIAEVAAQVGYENYKSFYRAFKDAVGTTPVEYQQKKYRIHREDEKQ